MANKPWISIYEAHSKLHAEQIYTPPATPKTSNSRLVLDYAPWRCAGARVGWVTFQ